MAYEYPTMLDLAKKTGSDSVVGLIEANLGSYPEVATLPSRTISGTGFKTLLRTAYPTVGFRHVNEGVEPKKGTYENREVSCAYIDTHMEVDEAVVDADNGDIANQQTLEASGHMAGVLKTLGKQVWYGVGTGGDAKGFPGAISVVPSGQVIDATGTTDNVASSAWLIVPGGQNGQFIFGQGRVLTMPSWSKQRITRSSKELMAFVSNISGWTGFQWVNQYCVGRIKKLTTDSGKGLTDSLVADLIATFPSDIDLSGAKLFMTRRSARQLQKSRTPTSASDSGARRTATGVEIAAPWPIESNGIPIVITSSIVDTETLAL
jgi:hypothetical protein